MSDLLKRLAQLSPEKQRFLVQTLRAQPGRFNIFPLSFAQQRLWFLDQWAPGDPVYHLPGILRMAGRLDVAALAHSLRTIIQRHESLRTTFVTVADQPFQVVHPQVDLALALLDLRGLPGDARERSVQQLARVEARRPFDLARGPLLRATLLRLEDQQHVLLLTLHHIIADGWSLGVLWRELAALYDAYATGGAAKLPDLPIQYAEYALWQRVQLQGEQHERLLAYWRRQLDGALPLLALPTDRPRPAAPGSAGARTALTIPQPLAEALAMLGQRESATTFMTMLAAFATLLYRYSGQADIVVGAPIAGRTRAETIDLIGCFVNTLALRIDLSGDPSFRELLRRVRVVCLGAYDHQELPFEQLVEELQPQRSLSHTPLFQVLLALQEAPLPPLELPGLEVALDEGESGTAKFDLAFDLTATASGLRSGIEYRSELFEAATITRLAAHFQAILEGVTADPAQRIRQVRLLSAVEWHELVVAPNLTQTPYPHDACLHELVAAQAARTPDAVALVFDETTNDQRPTTNDQQPTTNDTQDKETSRQGDKETQGRRTDNGSGFGVQPPRGYPAFSVSQMTYRELNARANRLAHYLRALGVRPEVRVGLCLERSLELVIGLLGVLEAGGAYVPLDPAYPHERITFMLEDSGATVVLTMDNGSETRRQGDKELADLHVSLSPPLLVSRTVVDLRADWPSIAQWPDRPLEGGAAADNLAYIIYTSGSTGHPKGVLIQHRGVINAIQAACGLFDADRGSRILQNASASFDASVLEVFMSLLSGATLHIAPPEAAGLPDAIAQMIQTRAINIAVLTPSFLDALPAAAYPDLRALSVGGERCEAATLARWAPGRRFLNLYAPTEATIYATHWVAPDPPPTEAPLGRPIANMQLYVLDAKLQPVPIGLTGEIYLGGVGLARGYHGRPDLTATRFIPNPFAEVSGIGYRVSEDKPPDTRHPTPGTRLYRTGDLARYRADGSLEFMGRSDEQVKLRGIRIELGEIVAVLARHPAVRETAVVVREDGAGDKRLVAYVVTTNDQRPTTNDQRPTTTDDSANKETRRQGDEAASNLLVSLSPGLSSQAPSFVSGLRDYLKQKLPEYMLPSAFVLLEALPLTQHGKLDRKALPPPEQSHPELEGEFVSPRTLVEMRVAEIWAEVLGLERVGIHDNFFELGGHSLLAAQVIFRLSASFGMALPLRSLFEAPTIAALASRIAPATANGARPPAPAIARLPRAQYRSQAGEAFIFPASFAQQRLWLIDQFEPSSASYSIPLAVRLSGSLDVPALRQSLDAIAQRHDVLRTTFTAVDGEPMQVVAAAPQIAMPIIDLREVAVEEREQRAQQLATTEARAPFDLAHGPLLRTALLRLGAQEHILLLNMHHIIADGWSAGVLVREISAYYAGYATGAPAQLPELPVQYADYAVWQRQRLQGAVLEAQWTYWKTQLGGRLPVLALPTDHPRPPVQSFQGAQQAVALTPELTTALNTLSQEENATLFMTLLAAFATLLYRYTGQDDIIVGSPIANRTRLEIEGLIGFFVNMLVLRTDLSENPSFRELLGRVRAVCLGAYAHQDLPFEQLVEELLPRRDLSRAPLFTVAFALQNAPLPELHLPGLTLQPIEVTSGTAKYDLTLNLRESPAGIHGFLEYNTDLFEAATIARTLEHFKNLLEGIAADPGQRLANLPLMSEAEWLLLEEWSVA